MTSGPNWARRYEPRTRRLCARPGCGAPAAATLRFQPTRREAWLVDLDENAARTEGDLCARHAVGLVLPRGWELHNDLSVDLRGAREPGAGDAEREAAPRRRNSVARSRRTGNGARAAKPAASTAPAPAPTLPGLDDPPDPATGDEQPAPEPQAERAPAPVDPPKRAPAPVPSPDPDDALGPQTPLLRRAFGNVWLPDRDT